MNVRTSIGPIPEKLFVYARAIVTAGLVQKPIIALSVRKDSRGQAWPRAASRISSFRLSRPRSRGDVVKGRLSKQIAGDIGISEPTVKVHRSNLMNVRSLAALGRIADKLQLLSEKT